MSLPTSASESKNMAMTTTVPPWPRPTPSSPGVAPARAAAPASAQRRYAASVPVDCPEERMAITASSSRKRSFRSSAPQIP